MKWLQRLGRALSAAVLTLFGQILFLALLQSLTGWQALHSPLRKAALAAIWMLTLAMAVRTFLQIPPKPKVYPLRQRTPRNADLQELLRKAHQSEAAAKAAEAALHNATAQFKQREARAQAMLQLAGLVATAARAADAAPASKADARVLQAACQTSLALRHVVGQAPQPSLCALGGLPVAPPDFDYPVKLNDAGQPCGLSFMAQIDCSRIPPGTLRDLLPAQGHLYFFMPGFDCCADSPYDGCVRFVDAPAGPDWAPRRPPAPAILPPLLDADFFQDWLAWHPHPAAIQSGISPRIEVELGWVAHAPVPAQAPADRRGKIALCEGFDPAQLRAFYGEIPPMLDLRGEELAEGALPYPAFPINRLAAQMLIGAARVAVQGELAQLDKLKLDGAPDAIIAGVRALREALLQEAQALAAISAAAPDPQAGADALDEAERAELRAAAALRGARCGAWLELHASLEAGQAEGTKPALQDWHLRTMQRHWRERIMQAAIWSADIALRHPQTAGLVPADFVARLRALHHPLRDAAALQAGRCDQHQMLGSGRDVQGSASVYGQTHLLLMQFSPDAALQWNLGDMGVMQYWITPVDLALRRFERVVATFESH